MLFKEFAKKTAVLSVAFGLVASPMAFAHTSIELNKDRSAGHEVVQPSSHNTSGPAQYSASDLTHDEGDTLDYSPSSSRNSDSSGSTGSKASYQANELNRDEGDGIRW
ncbi:hypothetical protein [Halomonas sp. DWK9]|uniref:hypothetical protein n=1 Tax=Halomonas sp. DWK9 TaxID=3060155 RepID=UPI00287FE465|nr:hypothetical protein [Halomonas sp. DWK9]